MPTLKILIGERLVDAEIVMHEGALYAKVPDEYLGSSMPVMTAKLQAQTEAVGLLLSVGDLVRGVELRFSDLYGKDEATKPLKEHVERLVEEIPREYQRCRELYEAGKFDLVKARLSAIRYKVRQEMISLEMRQLVKEELDKYPDPGKEKSKKIRIVKEDEIETFHAAARFDGARLEAKLFGAEPEEPPGKLLPLPSAPRSVAIEGNPCECDCTPDVPASDPSWVGQELVIQRFIGSNLKCDYHKFLWGKVTGQYISFTCSRNEGNDVTCYKSILTYLPVACS